MILKKPRCWQRVWPALFTGVGVGLVGACAWPYTVDDAYIVARYALRLSRGQGYTWNPGPATDGVTGPAWLGPGLVAAQLGYDPVMAAKLAGMACAVAAAIVCVAEQRRRARGTALAWLTASLMVCQPGLGGSGSSGLETGAATLGLTLAASGAFATPAPRVQRLGWAVASLAWLRPELAPACAVLLAVATWRAGWRRVWRAWALAGAGAAAVCLFRLRMNGTVLPLSWYAKAGTLQDGWSYAMRGVVILSGAGGAVLAIAGAKLGHARERARAWTVVVHVFAVVLAGGDWMPGFRLLLPVYPQYAALAATGAERLWRRRSARARLATAAAFGLACAIPALDLALRVPQWQQAGQSRERVGAAIARELSARSSRVALVDIGYLGYASGVETIDLAGLTDPGVAAFPGGHLAKHIAAAWLAERRPDTLVLHSSTPPLASSDGRLLQLTGYPVEMRIASFDWVRRRFRVEQTYAYGPAYYYVLLRDAQRSASHGPDRRPLHD